METAEERRLQMKASILVQRFVRGIQCRKKLAQTVLSRKKAGLMLTLKREIIGQAKHADPKLKAFLTSLPGALKPRPQLKKKKTFKEHIKSWLSLNTGMSVQNRLKAQYEAAAVERMRIQEEEGDRARKAMAGGTAVTSVDSEADIKDIPYFLQADEAMYSPENLRKRALLRRDQEIREAVRRWWVCARRNPNGFLEEHEYLKVNFLICRTLVPDYDDDPVGTAKADWEEDSKGKSEMDFNTFFNAIFELADMWCDDIDASQYCEFLDGTLKQMAKVPPWPPTEFNKVNWVKGYKDVDQFGGKGLRGDDDGAAGAGKPGKGGAKHGKGGKHGAGEGDGSKGRGKGGDGKDGKGGMHGAGDGDGANGRGRGGDGSGRDGKGGRGGSDADVAGRGGRGGNGDGDGAARGRGLDGLDGKDGRGRGDGSDGDGGKGERGGRGDGRGGADGRGGGRGGRGGRGAGRGRGDDDDDPAHWGAGRGGDDGHGHGDRRGGDSENWRHAGGGSALDHSQFEYISDFADGGRRSDGDKNGFDGTAWRDGGGTNSGGFGELGEYGGPKEKKYVIVEKRPKPGERPSGRNNLGYDPNAAGGGTGRGEGDEGEGSGAGDGEGQARREFLRRGDGAHGAGGHGAHGAGGHGADGAGGHGAGGTGAGDAGSWHTDAGGGGAGRRGAGSTDAEGGGPGGVGAGGAGAGGDYARGRHGAADGGGAQARVPPLDLRGADGEADAGVGVLRLADFRFSALDSDVGCKLERAGRTERAPSGRKALTRDAHGRAATERLGREQRLRDKERLLELKREKDLQEWRRTRDRIEATSQVRRRIFGHSVLDRIPAPRPAGANALSESEADALLTRERRGREAGGDAAGGDAGGGGGGGGWEMGGGLDHEGVAGGGAGGMQGTSTDWKGGGWVVNPEYVTSARRHLRPETSAPPRSASAAKAMSGESLRQARNVPKGTGSRIASGRRAQAARAAMAGGGAPAAAAGAHALRPEPPAIPEYDEALYPPYPQQEAAGGGGGGGGGAGGGGYHGQGGRGGGYQQAGGADIYYHHPEAPTAGGGGGGGGDPYAPLEGGHPASHQYQPHPPPQEPHPLPTGAGRPPPPYDPHAVARGYGGGEDAPHRAPPDHLLLLPELPEIQSNGPVTHKGGRLVRGHLYDRPDRRQEPEEEAVWVRKTYTGIKAAGASAPRRRGAGAGRTRREQLLAARRVPREKPPPTAVRVGVMVGTGVKGPAGEGDAHGPPSDAAPHPPAPGAPGGAGGGRDAAGHERRAGSNGPRPHHQRNPHAPLLRAPPPMSPDVRPGRAALVRAAEREERAKRAAAARKGRRPPGLKGPPSLDPHRRVAAEILRLEESPAPTMAATPQGWSVGGTPEPSVPISEWSTWVESQMGGS